MPAEKPNFGELAKLDGVSLALMAMSLASLEIGLKQSPHDGWLSSICVGLLALSALSGALFVWRTLHAAYPVVQLATFRNRSFAIGCALSFCLGVGLFGSVYLIPVFLAFVRGRDALQIGLTMLVTGAAQLAMSPIAVALERRLDPRWLTAMGFALFALGLGLSMFQTRNTDFNEMFWPQIIRGVAIMFCLLPPTRLALGSLSESQVPDASGPLQPDAQSGRRHRHRADRYHPVRANQHPCRCSSCAAAAGDATAATAIGLDPGIAGEQFAHAGHGGLPAADDRKGCVRLERQRRVGGAGSGCVAGRVARAIRVGELPARQPATKADQ